LFAFAKVGNREKDGLTARNDNGAILLAQVLGQIDRSFDIVAVVSPSTINQDLMERLEILCGVFGKQLMIFDQNALVNILAHFEEQASFDRIDVSELYRRSSNDELPKDNSKLPVA